MKTFLSGLLTESSSANPKIAKRAEFLVSYIFDTHVNNLRNTTKSYLNSQTVFPKFLPGGYAMLWTQSGRKVDRKWIGSGPKQDRKSTKSRSKVDQKWIGSRPKLDRKFLKIFEFDRRSSELSFKLLLLVFDWLLRCKEKI